MPDQESYPPNLGILDIRSVCELIHWPAIPTPVGANALAVLFQLERCQWYPPESIQERQRWQLQHVLRHAKEHVPYYEASFERSGLDPEARWSDELWRRWPILRRQDLQEHFDELQSRYLPASHAPTYVGLTSGSTGRPARFLQTQLTSFLNGCFTLRDHLWHRPDMTGTLAMIRETSDPDARPPGGKETDGWGTAPAEVTPTGKMVVLSANASISEIAGWLARVNPDHLLIYPSLLQTLVREHPMLGDDMNRLRHVRTYGEALSPSLRQSVPSTWGVDVIDIYSAKEAGYIAIQCPQQEGYHIQSENVLVEILDESGAPCRSGSVGRVVLTTLHNMAMPLIRYEIGDYAEVGESCPCGRTLPVLRRILGRRRNLLRLPDGRETWPSFGHGATFNEIAANLPVIRQFQCVQTERDRIRVLLVGPAGFTPDQERLLREYLQRAFGHPFVIEFHFVDVIPRGSGGKYEEFRSELTG